MKRFVILAAPRTGSNLLCTMLQSHPDVLCHHELFNPRDTFFALPLRDKGFSLGSMHQRNTQPIEFLNRIWRQNLGHQCVGFKMTHKQHLRVFEHVCKDKQIAKIVLKRASRLKTYVSRLIAQRSGVWEDYQVNRPHVQARPIDVPYDQLKQSIEFNKQYYSSLDRIIQGPRLDVQYENLNDTNTHSRLLNFLQLRDTSLQSQSRQQNPYPVGDLISNKNELANQLNLSSEDQLLLAELGHPFLS